MELKQTVDDLVGNSINEELDTAAQAEHSAVAAAQKVHIIKNCCKISKNYLIQIRLTILNPQDCTFSKYPEFLNFCKSFSPRGGIWNLLYKLFSTPFLYGMAFRNGIVVFVKYFGKSEQTE